MTGSEGAIATLLINALLKVVELLLGEAASSCLNELLRSPPTAFAKPEKYFSEIEKKLSGVSLGDFTGFDDYLKSADAFVSSGSKNVLLIHAPGGYGKSHLLRDVARRAKKERKVYVLRPGRDIEQALPEGINSYRKYLLILDDAERSIEETISLLKFVRTAGEDVKVILSFRTAGYYLISQEIAGQKLSANKEEIKINQWAPDDLSKLLKAVSGLKDIPDEEIIIGTCRNPYFIVLMGNKLKNQPLVEFETLKTTLVSETEDDGKKALQSLDNIDTKELLFLVASLAPLKMNEAVLLKQVAEHLNTSGTTVETAVNKLVEAGILRKVGNAVRFDPDMTGDVYLADRINSMNAMELENFILKWVKIKPKIIFSNIGSACRRESKYNKVYEVLRGFVQQWVTEASKTSRYSKEYNLSLLSHIAFLLPSDTLDLLAAYLEDNNKTEDKLSTDAFGPVILALMMSPGVDRDLLNTLQTLETFAKHGMYDNYRSKSLMEEIMSPIIHDAGTVRNRLDVIEEWVVAGETKHSLLARYGLSEILRSAHEYDVSWQAKLISGVKTLRHHPVVIDMRNTALSIVEKMLLSKNRDMVINAIAVLEELGTSHRGELPAESIPLYERFSEERQQMIGVIQKAIERNTDLLALNHIEHLLIKWWAQEKPGTEGVGELLRSFPRTPEYLAVRSMIFHDYLIDDFAQLETEAPEGNKWHWFVENVMSASWRKKPADFKALATELNKKYHTPQKAIGFLQDFCSYLLDSVVGFPHPLVLMSWAEIDKELFFEIRKDKEKWASFPDYIKEAIDGVLAETSVDHIRSIKEEVFNDIQSTSVSKTSQLIDLSNSLPIDEQTAVLEKLAIEGTPMMKANLISNLHWVYKARKDMPQIVKVYLLALKSDKPIDLFFGHAALLLRTMHTDLEKHPEEKKKVCDATMKVLHDHPRILRHENEIINHCLPNLKEIVDFVFARIERARDLKSSEYNAVPYEGLYPLNEKVKSYEDYKYLMDKAVDALKNEENAGWVRRDIDHLISPVALQGEDNDIYLIKYVEELLTAGEISMALTLAKYLALNDETVDILKKLGTAGLGSGLETEVRSLFSSKTFYKGGYISTVGQVPSELLSIRDTFEKMYESLPPSKLREIVSSCVEQIRSTIQHHKNRDEEMFD